jgi:hypothetical protein
LKGSKRPLTLIAWNITVPFDQGIDEIALAVGWLGYSEYGLDAPQAANRRGVLSRRHFIGNHKHSNFYDQVQNSPFQTPKRPPQMSIGAQS